MEKVYNKLVRDKIPQIIKDDNRKPITRVLSDEEYKKALNDKLLEEYNEVIVAGSSNELMEELADMIEVIRAISLAEGRELEDVIEISKVKRLKRGAFDDRIFLERVLDSDES